MHNKTGIVEIVLDNKETVGLAEYEMIGEDGFSITKLEVQYLYPVRIVVDIWPQIDERSRAQIEEYVYNNVKGETR